MFLARVTGTVVATVKAPGLDGIRLLVVQPVDEDRRDRGTVVVAADVTQAGPGDIVHVTTSREAAIAMPDPFVPVDAAIVAIVDAIDVQYRHTPPAAAQGKSKKTKEPA